MEKTELKSFRILDRSPDGDFIVTYLQISINACANTREERVLASIKARVIRDFASSCFPDPLETVPTKAPLLDLKP